MPFLKNHTGPYSVGTVDLTVPIEKPITVGGAHIPDQDEDGLRLEEVAFTVFYPTDIPKGTTKYRKGLRWLTGCAPGSLQYDLPKLTSYRSLKDEIAGFQKFAGVSSLVTWLILAPFIYVYGQFIKIPIHPDAPLLHPSEPGAKWPLLIFSHGLGGNTSAYSQLCMSIASTGKVVLIIQHRDGTSPVCRTLYKGKNRTMMYVKESEVRWTVEPSDALPLRVDQLAFRQHEIYTAYAAFSKLVCGPKQHHDFGSIHFVRSGRDNTFQETWSNAPIALENICLAGHSFGGCTMFSILSSKPPAHPSGHTYPRLPVRDTLIYDPWLEPLPSPGPTPFTERVADDNATLVDAQLNETLSHNGDSQALTSTPRLLVMNSEAFSLWRTHFERLKGVVTSWKSDAALVSLGSFGVDYFRTAAKYLAVKSAHTSFSDYHVFPLTGDKPSMRLLEIISKVSISFLDGRKDDWSVENSLKSAGAEVLHEIPEKIVIGKRPDGSNRHRWAGEVGQVVVH
ncbi:hypothetical protein D9757_002652 [Collybiopsis confluens]|uniref:1-alkyl-2-acetylglycerophosphocholine esterase n=1 Tax=Collybiopsis confluens TaxID=2823264 RepID=A0A8H5ME64_9AGAR|nr:hypothetical protein D9757_002652 [Collybiopsis confluens]